ncbi:MAG: flagellar biosynthetic protein FliO [Blastocatellia bacterium]|nr:flagellar biosynthetic protein FliO [Blastocatellia bacterium]
MFGLFFLFQIDPAQSGQQADNLPLLGDGWTIFLVVVKMCLMLGAVCLLAFLTIKYLLPKLAGIQSQQGTLMRVVARHTLEPQKTLYIIDVAGKQLLLGVTTDRIQVLSELEQGAITAALEAVDKQEPISLTKFGSDKVKEFSKYLRR